jgi:hypothetical protein
MQTNDVLLTLAGIVAWLAVALVAVVAVENWDPLWGFFPVAAAVVAAWLIGERVTGGMGVSQ